MMQKSSMNVGDRDLSGQVFRKVGGYQGRSGRGTENLARSGTRFPDLPAYGESLYRPKVILVVIVSVAIVILTAALIVVLRVILVTVVIK
jgi:hypothetical protein